MTQQWIEALFVQIVELGHPIEQKQKKKSISLCNQLHDLYLF